MIYVGPIERYRGTPYSSVFADGDEELRKFHTRVKQIHPLLGNPKVDDYGFYRFNVSEVARPTVVKLGAAEVTIDTLLRHQQRSKVMRTFSPVADTRTEFDPSGSQWTQLIDGSAFDFSKFRHDLSTLRPRHIIKTLSQINRFNGATKFAYSVCQHSVLTSEIARILGASMETQLLALLHDVHEIAVGDVITPYKQIVAYRAQEIESQADLVLLPIMGVNPARVTTGQWEVVKRADLIALRIEYEQLCPKRHKWNAFNNFVMPAGIAHIKIKEMTPKAAAKRFETRHKSLLKKMNIDIQEAA